MGIPRIMRFVFPDLCAVCHTHAPEGGSRICLSCRRALDYVFEPICRGCGGPLETDHSICRECENHPRSWEKAATAFRFEGLARQCVHRLKYNGDIAVAPFLGRAAIAAWRKLYLDLRVDCICPVPLHWWRKFRRGYNQAELICEEMQTDIPVKRLLKRHRPTPPQANLSRAKRVSNINRAFKVVDPGDVKGQHVLLVDDVMTTGSTLGECSKCLRKAGAAKVHILTVARRV